MKPDLSLSTRATLLQLEAVKWFRSVGNAKGKFITAVPTWPEALRRSAEPIWEEVQLEAGNQLGLAIRAASVERYRLWNDVVARVKPITTELVSRKAAAVIMEQSLPQAFLDSVQWDILHLAIETEYSDLVSVGFFANIAYWYREGHWPCGWEGTLNTGRLLVF